MEKKLVLASASPRRRSLLKEAGLSYTVRPAGIDEDAFSGLRPSLMVQLLAARKAAEVLSEDRDEWIIGADTVVAYGDTVLGKPQSREDAARMLRLLSGKTHSVFTGVAVIRTKDGYMQTFCEETRVTFRTLDEAEITAYIETGEPMDKAGAYGIQGEGSMLVEKTEGDFNNVVGLPVARLLDLIAEMERK